MSRDEDWRGLPAQPRRLPGSAAPRAAQAENPPPVCPRRANQRAQLRFSAHPPRRHRPLRLPEKGKLSTENS